MLNYNPDLKHIARRLRSEMTEGEQALWSRLRGKQLEGVQFYRQRPIGRYIVDFYAPRARLVVEVDGSQHLESGNFEKDAHRDEYLRGQSLRVLRFNNLQVLKELDAVVDVIFETLRCRSNENPPTPLCKGGRNRSLLNAGYFLAKHQ